MMRTFSKTTLLLVLMAWSQPALAQSAPPTNSAAGSAIVWGRVVEKDTAAPIPNAVVALLRGAVIGSPPADRVRADENGYFVFRQVQAGSWGITSGRSGYGSSQLEPVLVTAIDGQRSPLVTIRLQKHGAIEGRVIDEFDEPVAGMGVRFGRKVSHDRWQIGGALVRTDDRGTFTFPNLLPGEYFVFVPSFIASRLRTPRDDGSGGATLTIADSLVNLSASAQAPKLLADGRCLAYPAVFSPAGTNPGSAVRVVLGTGEVRRGLDVHLAPVEAARVTGTVVSAQGPMTATVKLMRADVMGVQPEIEAARTSSAADGRFEFPCVPRGAYVVSVLKESASPAPAGPSVEIRTGSEVLAVNARPSAPAQRTVSSLSASLPLSVGRDDITGVTVFLKNGVRISGRVVLDGLASQQPPEFMQRTVQFVAPDRRTLPYRPASVGPDLTFSTPEIQPGRYLLYFVTPPHWQVRSAMLEGRDISDEPFDLGDAPVGDVVITLTNRATRVSGAVRTSAGQLAQGSPVIVFSTNPKHWQSISARRVKLTRTMPTGTYVFAGSNYTGSAALPAGEYYLVAPVQEPAENWQDPAELAQLAIYATRVTVTEGMPVAQDLRTVEIRAWRKRLTPGAHQEYDADSDEVDPAEDTSGPFVTEVDEQVAGVDVSGRVATADRDEKPVRGATISLSPSGGGRLQHAVTDDTGRFTFPSVEPGYYRLTASKAGLLATEYGAKGPGRPGISLAVFPGRFSGVTLEMSRGAAVSGTVHDRWGRPLPGAAVRVISSRGTSSGPVFSAAPGAVSREGIADYAGNYRVSGLLPGEYVIGVTVGSSGGSSPARRTTPADLAAARATGEPGPRSARDQIGPAMVSVSSFYPNTRDLAAAVPVTLAVAEERPGIDFTLAEAASFRLTGIVVSADGRPAPNSQLILWPAQAYLPASFLRENLPGHVISYGGKVTIVPSATAGFSVQGLTAGRYTLFALTPVSGDMQWARQTIDIESGDLNVTVRLAPAMKMSGRVVSLSGATLDAAVLSKASVVLQSADSDGPSVAPPESSIDADATFTVSNIVPGTYYLATSHLPAPWSVISAEQNGREVLDGPLVIDGPEVPGLTVTLSNRPSELAGVFSDASGQPATDYFVIVFSANPKDWFQRSRRVVATRPRSDGSYVIQNLPAGEYRMAAVTDVQPDEWLMPDFLKSLLSSSVRVIVKTGERTEQSLRISR
jgi:uncharacterized protein (DUF2141 family)